MSTIQSEDISAASARFEAALARLEVALAASVSKVADLARATGFEEGHQKATQEAAAQASNAPADMSPILREELAAARANQAHLQDAVDSARAALSEAMDDIREVLGPV